MSYRVVSRAFGLVFALAMPLAQAQTTYQFDLPSQPLAASLHAVAKKSGANVLFESNDVKGIKAASLHADLSPDEAIKRLLAGTALEATSTIPGTVVIRPKSSDHGSADQLQLQEIVVSARRKEELLTTVPASITAYTADFMQKEDIRSFVDYATRIPNLTFQYGQGANLLWSGSRTTIIRGVAGEGTTAFYINDTPVPSTVSPQTLDLDRIEVLKGPQGTLFGQSSMGGTLRFITKKPSLDTSSGTVRLSGGGTKDAGADYESDFLGNFALIPGRMGVDAAFGYTHDSGFSKRSFPDASGHLVVKGDQGADDIYSASVALRTRISDSLEATLSFIGESTYLHGFPAAYVPLPGYRPLTYTEDRAADVPEYSKDRWGLGAFVLNYSAGGYSVVSSTSFFKRRVAEQEDDTEGTNFFFQQDIGVDLGNTPFYTDSINNTRLVTQETRLSFADGTLLKRLSGTVGVFYQHSVDETYLPIIPVPAMAAAGLYPAFVGANSAVNHGDSTAVFGEFYYNILPKLTATLGLRQYWITQQADPAWDYGFIFGPDPVTEPGYRDKESGLVPKAVLSYKVGDEGNVYASASKGFRAGGTQLPLPDICAPDLANLGVNQQDILKYKSDTLWSYEVGAKSRLDNGRMTASAAAFEIDWSNIQQTAWLPQCTLSFITNAGKARIRGGELELSGKPVADVPLSIQLGLGYTNGVLIDPGVLPQAPNSPLSQIPQWTGSIATFYERPVNNRISLFVAADYSYTGSVSVADGTGGFLERQPFNILNGNIGINFGRSQLLLYGKNLLDKRLNFGDQPSAGFERQVLLPDGSPERLPRAVVSRPRQVGLQYQVTF